MDDPDQPELHPAGPEEQLGAQLRSARERQGVSLRELARQLHRAHSSLVEYERGQRLAPLDAVEGYEAALGLRTGSLLELRVRAEAERARIGRDGSLPGATPPARGEHREAAHRRATPAPAAASPPARKPRILASWRAGAALALAVAAALALVVMLGRDDPPGAETSTLAGNGAAELAAEPAAERITVVAPPSDAVPSCWVFTGTADLRPGRTLVLGAKNLDNNDPDTYFEAVGSWPAETGRGKWSQAQFFGSTAGQRYAITVIAISTKALKATLAAAHNKSAPTAWAAPAPLRGGTVMKTLHVRRRAQTATC